MGDKKEGDRIGETGDQAELKENHGQDDTHREEEPQIFALKREGSSWVLNRRNFVAAAASAAVPVVLGGLGVSGLESDQSRLAMAAETADTIIAHQDMIWTLAISPDGKILASGSSDKTVKLWSLPEGGFIKALDGHTNSVYALAVSPDNQTLASGGLDANIRLWSLPGGDLQKTLSFGKAGVDGLAFNPQKRLLVTANIDKTITLAAFPGGENPQTITGIGERSLMALSPDGEFLITGTGDKKIGIWSLTENKLVQTIDTNSDLRPAVVISPVDKVLMGSGHDAAGNVYPIRSWTMPDGALRETTTGHSGGINALAITPDGKILVSASEDKTIILWSLPHLTFIKKLEGHTDAVMALAITPDGKILASAGKDKRIILWNLPEGSKKLALIDLNVNTSNQKGSSFQAVNSVGTTVTYTVPCGTPLPAGAVCICNCVPGKQAPPCSCVANVCSCVSYQATSTYHYWYPN
jgi:WD40 repeat protein